MNYLIACEIHDGENEYIEHLGVSANDVEEAYKNGMDAIVLNWDGERADEHLVEVNGGERTIEISDIVEVDDNELAVLKRFGIFYEV